MTVLLGNGAGGFARLPARPSPRARAPLSIVVGDFNLDGKPDLATASIFSDDVTVLLGNGTGGFGAGSTFAVGADPISIAVVDANLDGKPDLTIANATSNDATVLLGNGTGGFAPAPGSPFAVGNDPLSIAVGDFNLDGKPDLTTADQNSDTVTVLLGDGAGGFGAASPFAVGASPESVAVGDFNLDGRPDLATANVVSSNVTVLLNTCDSVPCPDAGVGFTSSSFAVGTGPESIAVGDFNLDGKPDLATANFNSNDVTVLLGNGVGGFAAAPGSPFALGGSFPESIAVGDVNLDGKPDLATANFNSNDVTVLLGNGAGGFAPAPGSPFAVGLGPYSIAVRDVNLDGKPDLATANNNSNNVTVLLGNGAGGFAAAPGSPFAVGSVPFSIAVEDVNLDGKPDIAAANFNSNNVTVLLGDGAGGFAPAPGSPFAVGTQPFSIAVGDVNLDGKPDLATANINSNDVTVLLGNGAGGFAAAPGSPFAVGPGPYSIAVRDVNLDGRPDLATANTNSNNVTVLLGNGAGGFAAAPGSPFAVGGTFPEAIAVADFNLDGKLDLVTTNAGSANVTVLLNRCNAPPVALCTDVTVSAGADCTANASIDNGSFDPDGDPITLSQSPPGPYAVGQTKVTLTVTDALGLSSQCAATVTVVDDTDPTIACPADIVTSTDPNQCTAVVAFAPTVTDNCSGATATCVPASGSAFPVGTTTVTCTAQDGAGNTSACAFSVTVNDTQAPAIVCPADITTTADTLAAPGGGTIGSVVTYPNPTVTDGCAGSSLVGCVPASGSFFPVGATTVTCTAQDMSGNTTTCSFTVTVNSPASVCFQDDASGDTFSEVVDSASPLYGFWQYRTAAGVVYSATADYTRYIARRSLISWNRRNPAYVMNCTANFGSGTATVTLTVRATNRRYTLRDLDTTNNPACVFD